MRTPFHLQFVAVEPCRILDTRKAGSTLHGTRTCSASLSSFASTDGTDGACALVWQDVQSGLVSAARTPTGDYELTFSRNVSACVPSATDHMFNEIHEISVDSDFSQDSTVFVSVKNSSTGDPEDTIVHLSLTC